MRLDAAFGFLWTAKGDLFERAIRPFLCFVSPRLFGQLQESVCIALDRRAWALVFAP